jgi:hypothetical protein
VELLRNLTGQGLFDLRIEKEINDSGEIEENTPKYCGET